MDTKYGGLYELDQEESTEIPTKNKCDHVIVFITLRQVAFESCTMLNMNKFLFNHTPQVLFIFCWRLGKIF